MLFATVPLGVAVFYLLSYLCKDMNADRRLKMPIQETGEG